MSGGLWDLAAAGYERHAHRLTASFASRALDLADVRPGQRVLDLACGPGWLTEMALARGASVTAVDLSAEMAARCRARCPDATVLEHDGQDLPFLESFDVAISCFGAVFFPDRGAGWASLLRSLRPGGMAVVTSWAPSTVPSPGRDVFEAAVRAALPDRQSPPPSPDALQGAVELQRELEAAGFVEVHTLDHAVEVHFAADELWTGIAEAMPPLVMAREARSEAEWAEVDARGRAFVTEHHDPREALSFHGYLAAARRP